VDKPEVDEDREIVFHYSRSARLAKASERVRQLADEGKQRKPTLFGTLTATKPLAFLFLAIIMLSVTAAVMGFLLPPENRIEIAGNRFTVSAFRYQGSTYVVIKKAAPRPGAATGTLMAAAGGSNAGDEGRYAGSFSVDERGEQEFRFAMDGEVEDFAVLVEFGGVRKTLRARAE